MGLRPLGIPKGDALLEGRKKSHGSFMAIRVKVLKDKTKEQSPRLELS